MRGWLEFDVYDEVDDVVNKFLKANNSSASSLDLILSGAKYSFAEEFNVWHRSAIGHWRQALYEKLIAVLSEKENNVAPDRKYRLLKLVMDNPQMRQSGGSPLKLAKFAVVRHSLDQLKQVEGYDPAKLNRFIAKFTERLFFFSVSNVQSR